MPALRPPAGFSLAELLIVVVILGITAGIALPLLTSAEPARLERSVAEVVACLDFARGEALRTGTTHGVRFGTADQRLRVFRIDTASGVPLETFDVRHPLSRQLYDIALKAGTGARIGAASFSFADGSSGAAVSFDSRGTPGIQPTSTGFARLTSGSVDVALAGQTRRVTVAAETGEVLRP